MTVFHHFFFQMKCQIAKFLFINNHKHSRSFSLFSHHIKKYPTKMSQKCHKCEEKCGKGRIDPETLKKLQGAYDKFRKANSQSLLKKHLTCELFDKIKRNKTSFNSSLMDCIQSGMQNLDSGVGIYAADPDCYTVFADLFDPIIEEYHLGFKKSDTHPATKWGNLKAFGNLDPKGQFIVSTRVRCARSIEGYPFNPCMTEDHYKEIETKITDALATLTGDLKGTYYPLAGMTKEVQQQLIDDHFLFKEGDRFLQAANACRFWPTGRGIFHNESKKFLCWVNEEDHLRIICLQKGGDLGDVYRRFVSAVQALESKLCFMKTQRFGYLTFCPSNLGNGIRASVHIKVPKLAAKMAKLTALADKFHLQVRGTAGEHTEAVGGVYDISNKRRLGINEYDVIKEMADGIAEIIKQEKASPDSKKK